LCRQPRRERAPCHPRNTRVRGPPGRCYRRRVADQTRARGQLDTAGRAPPPGAKKSRRRLLERAFAIALIVALVLHLVLLSFPLLNALRPRLLASPDDYDDPNAQAIIPIDLDLLADQPSAKATGAAAASPTPGDTAGKPPKPPQNTGASSAD